MSFKSDLTFVCVGSDVVEWLYHHIDGFQDRREARKYASNLLKAGFIRHTVNKITFSEQCYYIFGDFSNCENCEYNLIIFSITIWWYLLFSTVFFVTPILSDYSSLSFAWFIILAPFFCLSDMANLSLNDNDGSSGASDQDTLAPLPLPGATPWPLLHSFTYQYPHPYSTQPPPYHELSNYSYGGSAGSQHSEGNKPSQLAIRNY